MIPQTPQQITDSITIANLQQQIDSLSAQIHDIGIGTGYFESIISQQQTLFGILAGIFSLVVLVGIGVSYAWYFRRVESQLSDLKVQTKKAGLLVKEVDNMKYYVSNLNIDVRRALWEGSPRYEFMRVIWHIRYCEAFIQRRADGYLDDINWHFVSPKAKPFNLAEEYHYIKEKNQIEFYQFINFRNKGGIKRILRTILELAGDPKYKEMRQLSSEIIHDFEIGVELPKTQTSKRQHTPENNDDM